MWHSPAATCCAAPAGPAACRVRQLVRVPGGGPPQCGAPVPGRGKEGPLDDQGAVVGGAQAVGRARRGLGCVCMDWGGVDGHRGGYHNRNTSRKTKQAPLLYVIETDFVVIKPIVAPRAESNAKSIAFSCERGRPPATWRHPAASTAAAGIFMSPRFFFFVHPLPLLAALQTATSSPPTPR